MSARPDRYHLVLKGEAPDTVFSWACWMTSLLGWLVIPVLPIFAVPGIAFGVAALMRLEHHPDLGGRDLARIGITSCLLQLLLWSAIALLVLYSIPQKILVRQVFISG